MLSLPKLAKEALLKAICTRLFMIPLFEYFLPESYRGLSPIFLLFLVDANKYTMVRLSNTNNAYDLNSVHFYGKCGMMKFLRNRIS